MPNAERGSFPFGIVIAAAATVTVAALPKSLMGAFAVLIRDELGLGETQLGAAVSLISLVAALGSAAGGRVVQRIGAYQSMSLIAVLSAGALLGVAVATATYWHLLAWLTLAGAAMALMHPSAALAIAGGVSSGQRGLAFGLHTSAPPAALLVAGMAVPFIGVSVGWRWSFAAAAAGAALVAAVVSRGTAANRAIGGTRRSEVSSGKGALIVLSIGMGFANTAAGALGAFYVLSAVDQGAAVGAAGLWLAAGGLLTIGTRITLGRLADRGSRTGLGTVALLMAAGAVGCALLAYARSPLLLGVATGLAFAAGWGWPGLFQLAVTRRNVEAAAAAAGITQTGGFIGVTVGPLAFGALVEHASYSIAWCASAGALVVASLFIAIGWAMLAD